MITNALKGVTGVILGLLLVAGTAFALTATTDVLNLSLFHQTVQADNSANVVSQGFQLSLVNGSATGQTSGAAVEASLLNPSLNTALTSGDWYYSFTVKETGATAWNSSTTYTVTVYGDGVLLGTLYFKNATADAINIEGVTVKVDVGSSTVVPDGIDVQVQKTG
jgi:hypothetical protein